MIRASLLAALLAGIPAFAGDPAGGAPDDEKKVADSLSVGQSVQGEQGLNIQTMCTNCNEANLELAGMGDAHINVEMDGFRLFSGLPRIYALSMFPPGAVERVGVRTGPGLAEGSYEAIAGTIDVESRPPGTRPYLQADIETGSFGWEKLALAVDGAVGMLSGRLAVADATIDAIDADGDGFAETGDTQTTSGRAELALDFDSFGALRVGATRLEDEQVGGKGQVELDLVTHEPIGWLPEDTFVDWTDYQVGYDVRLAGAQVLSLRLSRFEREESIAAPVRASFEESVERYRIQQDYAQGSLRWRMPVGSRWLVAAGWGMEEDESVVAGESMPAYLDLATGKLSPLELTELVKGQGGFVQAKVDASPEVSLTFGTRYDEFKADSRPPSSAPVVPEGTLPAPNAAAYTAEPFEYGNEWSPRLSLSWKPRPSVQLRGSFGYGYTPARPVFNEICCGQTPERNTDVRPERSSSTAFDVTYQPSPAWKLNLYVHRTDFDEYIIKMVAGSVDLKQKLMQGNIGSARLQGASGFFSWKSVSGVNLNGSYTWLEAENNGDTVTLFPRVWDPLDVVIPVTVPLKRIPYLADARANLGVAWSPRGRFSIGANAQYTGSMLIQQYENVRYSFLQTFPPAGLLEEYRETPSFWLFNLNGWVMIGKHVRVNLVLDNVFDEVQSDLDDPTTDYNWGVIRGRYAAAGVSYLF